MRLWSEFTACFVDFICISVADFGFLLDVKPKNNFLCVFLNVAIVQYVIEVSLQGRKSWREALHDGGALSESLRLRTRCPCTVARTVTFAFSRE